MSGAIASCGTTEFPGAMVAFAKSSPMHRLAPVINQTLLICFLAFSGLSQLGGAIGAALGWDRDFGLAEAALF